LAQRGSKGAMRASTLARKHDINRTNKPNPTNLGTRPPAVPTVIGPSGNESQTTQTAHPEQPKPSFASRAWHLASMSAAPGALSQTAQLAHLLDGRPLRIAGCANASLTWRGTNQVLPPDLTEGIARAAVLYFSHR
jgi:hypothetical protein